MKVNWIQLIVALLVAQLAGIVGSVFTASSVSTWYLGIVKPSFNPPSWLFGPVWVTLFFLMGLALYLVWNSGLDAPGVKAALVLFAIQWVLNILWSVFFFGLRSPFLAFIEIVLLWISIVATVAFFYRISFAAAILLVPYLLWVSFAAILNLSIWRLNG